MTEETKEVAEHGDHKLYRCRIEGCGGVYLHEDVAKGGCPHCSGRRCGFATALTDEEAAYVTSRGFDLEKHGWAKND